MQTEPPETPYPVPDADTGNWSVYLILCSDGSLYCGITTDPHARFSAHAAGKGARYTRSRPPVAMRIVSDRLSRAAASRLENRIKKMKTSPKRGLWAESAGRSVNTGAG